MPRKWWVLVAVACGTFMATLDASIVNIALNTLTKKLHADLPGVKWVIVTYFLVITCVLLPIGKISDQLGRKKIFGLGFVTFTVGSALCGLSYSLNFLVLFRAIQAFGAAMLMANGPAIITESFPASERGRALGTLAMVVSVGLISGPGIGGALIAQAGWRSIFLINIPFGILGWLLVKKHVKKDPEPKEKITFDWKGATLQALALIFLINFMEPRIPGRFTKFFLLTLAAVCGLLFIWVEKTTKNPIFDLSFLKNRPFMLANVSAFLMFVSYSAIAVLFPYFLENQMQYPTSLAGYLMTALPVVIFIVAPISGRLSDRFGSRELCFLGASTLALTLAVLSGKFTPGLHEGVTQLHIVMGLSAIGLGLGLFQAPNNNTVMGTVPIHKLGVASALIAMIRNLGLVIGAGFCTAFFSWRIRHGALPGQAIEDTYWISAFVALAAAAVSLAKEKGPQN